MNAIFLGTCDDEERVFAAILESSIVDDLIPHEFLLIFSQIIPTAEEMWEAVKVIANKAMTA